MANLSNEMDYQVQSVVKLLPSFEVHREIYKQVNDQPIEVQIFVPKDVPSGRRPVLVKLHGGGFVEGNCSDWWRPWTLELALKRKVVIVSTDYRLIPESNFSEIVEDIQDFWTWLSTSFPQLPYVNVDLTDLALLGESAGGFLAAQSLSLGWTKDIKPKALILQYPGLLDPSSMNAILKAYSPSEIVPLSVLEDHLARLPPDRIVTRAVFGSRMSLVLAIIQHGKAAEFMLPSPETLNPMKSLDAMRDKMPPVFILHGKMDLHAPWESSRNWAEKLKVLQPEVPIYCLFRDGEAHVLDQYVTLDIEWMKEAVEFIEKYWPAEA